MKSWCFATMIVALCSRCSAQEHAAGTDGEQNLDLGYGCSVTEDPMSYMRCVQTWAELKTVQLSEYHKYFRYSFTFPKYKCCPTIHLYPQDLANHVAEGMSCDEKARTRSGFYKFDLATEASTTSHSCRVTVDQWKRENITCSGVMTFDSSHHPATNWTVAASRCGAMDGIEVAHYLEFSTERYQCESPSVKSLVAEAVRNATKDYESIHEQYPITAGGMVAIVVITALNSLMVTIGFIVMSQMHRAIMADRKRVSSEYSSTVFSDGHTKSSRKEKLPF